MKRERKGEETTELVWEPVLAQVQVQEADWACCWNYSHYSRQIISYKVSSLLVYGI